MPKKKNWIGYKFNTFEVIEEDIKWHDDCEEKVKQGTIKRYNNKYICRCSCGNIVSLCVTQIAKNKPLSCGCIPIRFGENLVGRTFGNWIVLERDIDKEISIKAQGKTFHDYWKCKCVCGNIVSVMGGHLKDGTSTNCGCLRNKKNSLINSLDLTGKIFGKLTCIKSTDRKSKNGKYWICKCDCGEYVEVLSYYLTSGKFTECNKCRANGFPSVKSYSVYLRNQEKIQINGSLGDELKNKYPNIILNELWSKRNILSPFELTTKSHQKVYLICPHCKEEFETSALQLYGRVYEIMCPDCLSKIRDSVYEKAVKEYLNISLGIKTLHENSCNLKPINPITGSRLFYDNELPEQKIIIEVHGKQHYELINFSHWLSNRSPEEWLKDLQVRDEYKKNFAINNGYKYLALNYKQILSGEYKKIIDNLLRKGDTNEI